MPAAEQAFEIFALALETVRGTAITPPTHYMPFKGMVKPFREKARSEVSDGTLDEFNRSKTVRAGSEFSGEGDADPNYAPLIFNMIMKANDTPTTPTDGVLTRLWTYTPTLTSDDLKSATMYGGDPNVQIFQAPYSLAEELTVSSDAGGTDAAKWSMKGFGRFPARVAAPAMPAQAQGDQLMPGAMQLWMDTGATAIGTTEVTGRFLSADWAIPTGVTKKYYAGGPTGGLNFSKTGRKKRSAKATIVVELNDVSIGAGKEYLTWEADTVVKMRIRLNGSLIESVGAGPTLYYSYIQLDIFGALDAFDWGDYEGNRTMQFEVTSERNATAGYGYALYAQNARTAL